MEGCSLIKIFLCVCVHVDYLVTDTLTHLCGPELPGGPSFRIQWVRVPHPLWQGGLLPVSLADASPHALLRPTAAPFREDWKCNHNSFY